MPPSEDLNREIESYLGFLIDHELDDVYETSPLNRTLGERKPAFRPGGAATEQKNVRAAPGPDGITVLRPSDAGRVDPGVLLHEARQRAAAARTLDELYAEIDAFTAMPMRHEGGKALVRCRGAVAPRLLVIGDLPDASEDAAGLAFQGKPGALIDTALAAAGIGGDAMLSPCAFWRPAGGRPLTVADIGLNQPFLAAMIRLAAPRAILLLGAAAVTSVLNLEQNLQKLRGRIIACGDGDGALPAMASFTPAFMIGQPACKALFWQDLLAIVAAINTL